MSTVVKELLSNGVIVHQVSDHPAVKDNIYCEAHYCSPAGDFFVYQRQLSPLGVDVPLPWLYRAEYVACTFGSWESRVLGEGYSYPIVTEQGGMMFTRPAAGGERQLSRIDLTTFERVDIDVPGGVQAFTGMTLTRDERHLAYGIPLSFDPQMFGIVIVDLRDGSRRVICEDPHISNPHPQYEPTDEQHILVQHNRGCVFNKDGVAESWLGEEGCTLFAVNVNDGAITRMRVGPPHTLGCTGHEQWVPGAQRVLATLGIDEGRSNLVSVGLTGEAQYIGEAAHYNHVNVSTCGRYFCCDDYMEEKLYVGSLATGRRAYVCDCDGGPADKYKQFGQSSHPHAWLSPDLKWVIFNGCRTGRPEIFVAQLPDGFFDALDAA